MGVHKLTTSELEALGRWKSKVNDPDHCPEYMVRTAKSKRTTKIRLKAAAATTTTTTGARKTTKSRAKKKKQILEVEEPPAHSEEMVSLFALWEEFYIKLHCTFIMMGILLGEMMYWASGVIFRC